MVAHCQVGGRSACAIVFSGSASTSPSSMTQISVRRKVEPSYFDSRRGWNAQSLDIGFAPDSLKMTTMACPAVEFLCLVGLQRFRPASTTHRRVFVDHTWLDPLSVSTGPGARERWRCCTNRHWPARGQSTGSSPADAIRHWSAESGHPIQDLTAEDYLTPLPGWAPGAKAISDDGLVSEERVLHPALTMVP